MPAVRARLDDVLARIRTDLAADVKTAAGNHLLSKSEAAGSPSKLVRDACSTTAVRSPTRRVVATNAVQIVSPRHQPSRRYRSARVTRTGMGDRPVRRQGRAAPACSLLTFRAEA